VLCRCFLFVAVIVLFCCAVCFEVLLLSFVAVAFGCVVVFCLLKLFLVYFCFVCCNFVLAVLFSNH